MKNPKLFLMMTKEKKKIKMLAITMKFLYSMDSFIYDVINTASRNKDESKVMSLGPITAALSQITLKA